METRQGRVCLLAKLLTVLTILITNYKMQIFFSSNLKLMPNWAILVKLTSGHWNYMGVVPRLLVASPACRLKEIHYVY